MSQTMPWGKYRGLSVEELPLPYLALCLTEFNVRDPVLKRVIAAEFWKRVQVLEVVQEALAEAGHRGYHRGTYEGYQRGRAECATLPANLANEWLRRMARRFHPDVGGTDAAMAAVNEGVNMLRELLAEVNHPGGR